MVYDLVNLDLWVGVINKIMIEFNKLNVNMILKIIKILWNGILVMLSLIYLIINNISNIWKLKNKKVSVI